MSESQPDTQPSVEPILSCSESLVVFNFAILVLALVFGFLCLFIPDMQTPAIAIVCIPTLTLEILLLFYYQINSSGWLTAFLLSPIIIEEIILLIAAYTSSSYWLFYSLQWVSYAAGFAYLHFVDQVCKVFDRRKLQKKRKSPEVKTKSKMRHNKT